MKGLSPLTRFWRMLKPDASEIRNIYFYAAFNGLVGLSLPLGIQAIVNLIQGGRVSTSFVVLVIIVVGGIALSGMLQIYQLRISENLQQNIFTRAAFEFTHRLPRIRMELLYRHYAPELMNRFFDVLTVQKSLSKILISFTEAGLQILFGLILLSFYHPFFILFSVFLVLMLYVIFRITAKRGLQSSLEESKYKYRLAHWLQEMARSAATFKLAGPTDLPMQNTDKLVTGYLKSREKHFGVLVIQYRLLILFKALVATGLLAMGGILVMRQLMNIGQFIAAEIIILMIMTAVEKLILSFETIYDVLTALEKIGTVTDLELDGNIGTRISSRPDQGLMVELKEVSFHYPDQERKVLQDINLKIEPGERIVLWGPSGSGKSSLLEVISGVYDLKHGYLWFDDMPSRECDKGVLHACIGGVWSMEQLFEGSVRDNITLGRPGISEEELLEIVRSLHLMDFIKSLPSGIDTLLEPQGRKIPKQFIQKILLARAIAGHPRLLLLEEILDMLSSQERHDLIRVLFDRSNSFSLVMATSDPEIARNADRVICMRNGEIHWTGKYDQIPNELKSHA